MELDNIEFEIKRPWDSGLDKHWIRDLNRERAKAFYANGQRPAFQLKTGEFQDPDTLDFQSYHILAYSRREGDPELVGAVRLLPLLAPEYRCVACEIMGESQFKKIIDYFEAETALMEVNRFFVREDYRHHILGLSLCAAAWWLGHYLNYSLITNGNIKLVEALYVKYLGAQFFPGLSGPYQSELYNDPDIYVVRIDKSKVSAPLLEQVEVIKPLLNLEPLLASVTKQDTLVSN